MQGKLKVDQGSLDRAFAELEKELADASRGLAVTLWNTILDKTPQLWGEMVASWTFTVGQPKFVDRSNQVNHVTPLGRGHQTAITIANDASTGNDATFVFGQTIYIANGVDHAVKVDSGDVFFRSVNRPWYPVSRAIGAMNSKYARGIGPYQFKKMKSMRIGV